VDWSAARRARPSALPRAAAVAELGWSAPERRRWPDFLERLVPMFERYTAFDLAYSDSAFAVAAQYSRNADGVTLILSNQVLSGQVQDGTARVGEIHYTLDGRAPTSESPLYGAPLTVPLGTEIHAATFVGAAPASRTWVRRLDARTLAHRDTHDLELCSHGIGLLLESGAGAAAAGRDATVAVDIENPCWIDRGVDLTRGPQIVAAVVPLPFNYEIGAAAAKIRVGDARTSEGELEVHVDGCDTPAVALLALAPALVSRQVTTLPPQPLPRLAGRHDLCLRFARPRLDPLWALAWVEIGE